MLVLFLQFEHRLFQLVSILEVTPQPIMKLLLTERHNTLTQRIHALVQLTHLKQKPKPTLGQLHHYGPVPQPVQKLVDVR